MVYRANHPFNTHFWKRMWICFASIDVVSGKKALEGKKAFPVLDIIKRLYHKISTWWVSRVIFIWWKKEFVIDLTWEVRCYESRDASRPRLNKYKKNDAISPLTSLVYFFKVILHVWSYELFSWHRVYVELHFCELGPTGSSAIQCLLVFIMLRQIVNIHSK